MYRIRQNADGKHVLECAVGNTWRTLQVCNTYEQASTLMYECKRRAYRAGKLTTRTQHQRKRRLSWRQRTAQ